MIIVGGGVRLDPSQDCCSTTMTAGAATALSWSNDVITYAVR